LRFHDPKNWPILREALINMSSADLIGTGPKLLIPPESAAEKSIQAPKGNARGGGGPGSVGKIPNRSKPTQGNARNAAGAIPRGKPVVRTGGKPAAKTGFGAVGGKKPGSR
jgi:hypothetical protein